VSETARTCDYVLDPGDPKTWGGEEGDECRVREEILTEEGLWECPHESEGVYETTKEKKEFCLFHAPINKKDDEQVNETLKKQIESPDRQSQREFLGAKFGAVKLNESLSANGPVHFSQATFESLEIKEGQFSQEVYFYGVTADGETIFRYTTFEHNTHFSAVRFLEDATFANCVFERDISFVNAKFHQDANFRGSEFIGEAGFNKVKFCNDALFGAEVGYLSHHVPSDDIPPMAVDFRGMVYFNKTEFDGRADFSWTSFDNGVDFTRTTMSDATFRNADLAGSIFTHSTLHNVNFESALLNRSSFYSADLRGARLLGALLGDARINEDTRFLGTPQIEGGDNEDTASVWDTLRKLRRVEYCVYDSDYENEDGSLLHQDIDDAKSVYRTLEDLARSSARPDLLSKCFVRRQDLQQKQYWRERKDADNPLEWLISVLRGSRAKVARATLLYGESPWRVIVGSISFIVLIALLYPLGEWLQPVGEEPIAYSRILGGEWSLLLESLYFSTLTFTTLGMGDYQPLGFGQVLATANTAFGAVLIALLVFVLGRRAAR
jgi:uncharacterized protein YjbI with pentapeptide repeats